MSLLLTKLIKYCPGLWLILRRLYPHLPFFLPHEESFYGFKHLAKSKDGLFVDVGANDGISALGFHRINPFYRIFSIEPNRFHEPALKKLKKEISGFDYLIAAAGDKNGPMVLYTPYYKAICYNSAASFSRDFLLSNMERLFQSVPSIRDLKLKEEKVDVIKLDDLCLEPDIVKLDTEGYDYEILLGLTKTIENSRPVILVEYNRGTVQNIQSFFGDKEYGLFVYDRRVDMFSKFNDKRELGAYRNLQMVNVFCIPREKQEGLPMV